MSEGAPRASSLADLYAIAYQIEADAVERYTMLADQMEMHNNPPLVDVFRDLARAEGVHRDEIRRMAGDFDVAAHARKVARWTHGESPESADLGAADYLMTPRDALQMALTAEQAALDSFRTTQEVIKKQAHGSTSTNPIQVTTYLRIFQIVARCSGCLQNQISAAPPATTRIAVTTFPVMYCARVANIDSRMAIQASAMHLYSNRLMKYPQRKRGPSGRISRRGSCG